MTSMPRWSRATGCLLLSVLSASACATGASLAPAPFPSLERPKGAASPPELLAKPDAAVQTALDLRGTRYRLGGANPRSGFDCSGLVSYVFSQLNLTLPRTVDEQFGYGQPIPFDSIQSGDLLFFATTRAGLEVGAATHVGIAVGPPSLGEFVHAPGSGSSVRVDRFDAPYWRARWVGARRVF
jgi:cell wall-associated NlpC family hydrolase